MPRGLTSAQIAATAAGAKLRQVVPLVELNFDAGTLRLAICPWDIVESGNTWTHTGGLLTVKAWRESAGNNEGMEFVMSGLNPSIFALATQNPYHGRLVRLIKAFLHPDTNQIIDAPKAAWIGRMRNMVPSEQNDVATISLVAEHYETELGYASPKRLNDADQQTLFPGDLGCNQVERMVEAKLIWPSKEALKR